MMIDVYELKSLYISVVTIIGYPFLRGAISLSSISTLSLLGGPIALQCFVHTSDKHTTVGFNHFDRKSYVLYVCNIARYVYTHIYIYMLYVYIYINRGSGWNIKIHQPENKWNKDKLGMMLLTKHNSCDAAVRSLWLIRTVLFTVYYIVHIIIYIYMNVYIYIHIYVNM